MTEIPLSIVLKADGSGLVGEVRVSAAELKKLGNAATHAGTEANRSRSFWSRFTQQQQATGQALARTERQLNLVRVAMLALATGGAARLVGSFVSAASETENLRVRLRFLTDDADAAADAVLSYAAKVPFAFQEIQQAAPILLTAARNQEEFNRLLEISGDIAAVSGLSFVETAQQIQRSFSAGINSADLFRERSVRAMLGFQAGVETSAKETRERILKLWEDSSFALVGASAEMADTWTGLTSMLGDKWFQFRVQLMNAEPFDFLKATVAELNAELDREFGSIGDAADEMGHRLVATVEDIALGTASVIDAVEPVADAVLDIANRTIAGFNALPDWVQELGLFGALFLGKKGRLALLAGAFGYDLIGDFLEGSMRDLHEKLVERGATDLGFEEWWKRRAKSDPFGFAGEQDTGDTLSLIGLAGGAGPGGPDLRERVEAFLAVVRERMAAQRAAAARRPGGRGQPGGGGAADADLEGRIAENDALLGGLLAGAAPPDGGMRGAILERHAETVKDIRDRLMDTLPAYERARRAAAQWRDEALKGLDATQAGYDDFAAQVDEIYNHMLKEAYEENLRDSREWRDGVTRALRDYAEAATDAAENAEQALTGAFRGMEDSLVSFTTRGRLEFSRFIDALLADIARAAIRQQITGPLAQALGRIDFGSIFGGTDYTYLYTSTAGGAYAHAGGVIGRDALAPANVDLRLFAGARRMHGGGMVGLAPDERPIVAKVGEEVLTPSDPRHRDNLRPTEIILRLVDGNGNEVPTRRRRTGNGQLEVEAQLDGLVARLGRRRGSQTREMLESLGAGAPLRDV